MSNGLKILFVCQFYAYTALQTMKTKVDLHPHFFRFKRRDLSSGVNVVDVFRYVCEQTTAACSRLPLSADLASSMTDSRLTSPGRIVAATVPRGSFGADLHRVPVTGSSISSSALSVQAPTPLPQDSPAASSTSATCSAPLLLPPPPAEVERTVGRTGERWPTGRRSNGWQAARWIFDSCSSISSSFGVPTSQQRSH
jgi:hypothetical protein